MRRVILLAIFSFFTMSICWGQVVVTNGGFATMQGPAVLPAPAWPPLIMTPQAHLATVMSAPVGITGAGRTGISMNDRGIDPQPSSMTLPLITNPGVVMLPAMAAPETEGRMEAEENAPEAAAPGTSRVFARRMRAPLGTSVQVQPKGTQRPAAVHTYTNDDMSRLQADTQAHLSIVGRHTGSIQDASSKQR